LDWFSNGYGDHELLGVSPRAEPWWGSERESPGRGQKDKVI